jgi:16S rRNA (cytosine1402-N4)-methyltransferase
LAGRVVEAEPQPDASHQSAAEIHGHVPVLVNEILAWLRPGPKGRYLDGTLGAGGHARALLEASAPQGRLLGLDRDAKAVAGASDRLAAFGGRAVVRRGSFREVRTVLNDLGWCGLDGAVLDLGLSSLQLAEPERGFSFTLDGALDMRFDQGSQLETAGDLVNQLDERELARLLWEYGEERESRAIAVAIVRARPIRSTRALADVVAAAGRRGTAGRSHLHPATRTFQALRIAVNDELGELQAGLPEVVQALNTGGRVAVISFHSLEDRIVKQTLRGMSGRAARADLRLPAMPDVEPILRDLTPKPIRPSSAETAANPRARSAKLRVAERIARGAGELASSMGAAA